MSITTENYLKQIFVASESVDDELVSLGELAQALNVTPGTVTTMMKSLANTGLVDYVPRRGVTLTPEGRTEAIQVLRRHRLIELFLVEVLGLDWSVVHEEAEILEHAISDRLLARIDEVLGHPTSDPHGDPIPDQHGSLPEVPGVRLSNIEPPATVRIERVDNENAAFLEFVKEIGLLPGTKIKVIRRSAAGGTITVVSSGTDTPLGLDAADRILCSQETHKKGR